MNSATRTARYRGPLLQVSALGALAAVTVGVMAPAAQATYAGKNGPIAFQRFTGPQENAEIFSMSPTGGRAHRLTTGPGATFNPDYSPNGAQVAFERRYGDGRPDAIFTVKSRGGRATKISSGCTGQCLGDAQPAWSPDGRQILFMRALGPVVHDDAAELDLMVMNRDGGDQRLIRRFGRIVDGRAPGAEGKAELSPDGRQIAVTLVTEGADIRRSDSAVYLMNADGSDLHAITPAKLHGGNPDWSPNGKLLVFHSNNYHAARSEIWVVKPNGKGLRRLRRLHSGRDYQPVWSPNGKQIAFGHDGPAVHQGGHVVHVLQHLWTMRSDGSHAHAITNPGDKPAEITPDWGSRR
jgi:Tol biopolymer transport system component